jgi:hypothetical protein
LLLRFSIYDNGHYARGSKYQLSVSLLYLLILYPLRNEWARIQMALWRPILIVLARAILWVHKLTACHRPQRAKTVICIELQHPRC